MKLAVCSHQKDASEFVTIQGKYIIRINIDKGNKINKWVICDKLFILENGFQNAGKASSCISEGSIFIHLQQKWRRIQIFRALFFLTFIPALWIAASRKCLFSNIFFIPCPLGGNSWVIPNVFSCSFNSICSSITNAGMLTFNRLASFLKKWTDKRVQHLGVRFPSLPKTQERQRAWNNSKRPGRTKIFLEYGEGSTKETRQKSDFWVFR